MKRILAFSLGFCLLFFLFPVAVWAAEGDLVEEQLKESGFYSLVDLIPDDGQELLPDTLDEEGIDSITVDSVFQTFWTLMKEKISAPVTLFFSILGTVFLGALLTSVGGEGNGGLPSMVTGIALCGISIPYILDAVNEAKTVIQGLFEFTSSFVPLFTGVCIASGKPVSAVAYHITLFSVMQLFSVVVSKLLLPLLGVFLGVAITSAVTGLFSASAVTKTLKSITGWILGLLITVFIGVLTVKSLFSAPADSLAIKTSKFVLSALVPVVGSALSDAYATVFSCVNVVKGTVGVFGIIMLVASFLPTLVRMFLLLFALKAGHFVAEFFDQKQAKYVLEAASTALSSLLGMIVCYDVMIIISIALMLLIGGGSS